MKRGLPAQEDALRRARAQSDAASQDSRQLEQAAQQQLRDSARRELINVTRDYVKSIDAFKKAAEEAKRRTGVGGDLDQLIDKLTDIKTDAERMQAQQNVTNDLKELLAKGVTLRERLLALNKLLVDTDVADKAFDEMVSRLYTTNPPAALLARASRVVLEFQLASEDSFDRAVEAQQASHTVNLLQDQLNRINDRISLLTSKCLTPATNNNATNNTNGGTNQPAKSGGMSKSTATTIAALAAGGAVAAWAFTPVEDFEDFSSPTTTSSNSSPPPVTSGASQFNGSYRAAVTRNCSAPAGVVCAQFSAASCSPTAFNFTVSNGVITDCGPWFGRGTVQSNGDYSGVYQGSAPNGVPVSGRFSTSGTFTLQGSSTQGGAQYTVTIQVSRQ